MPNQDQTFERRFISREVRMEEMADGQRHIIGYGAVFDEPSTDMGFIEIVERSAFNRVLAAAADVRGLYNHNPEKILGRTSAGTMMLVVDEIGLRYDIVKPETTFANDLVVSLDRGDVDKSSFGFRAKTDRWEQREGKHYRYLVDVDLFDVGPVTFPAYPQTSSEVRSRLAEMGVGGQAAGTPDTEAERAVGRLALLHRKLDLLG